MAIGAEIRSARIDRGLTTRDVAHAARCAPSTVSRVERGLVPGVTYAFLAVLAAIVGLDLVSRVYPGGQPLRELRARATARTVRFTAASIPRLDDGGATARLTRAARMGWDGPRRILAVRHGSRDGADQFAGTEPPPATEAARLRRERGAARPAEDPTSARVSWPARPQSLPRASRSRAPWRSSDCELAQIRAAARSSSSSFPSLFPNTHVTRLSGDGSAAGVRTTQRSGVLCQPTHQACIARAQACGYVRSATRAGRRSHANALSASGSPRSEVRGRATG